MNRNGLTITVIANITSNYGESLGNVSSIQKVYKNGNTYAIRSKESIKNSIMVQSGMYDDLQTSVNGAAQKMVTPELNATNCRALEAGYMNTGKTTYIRKSSFYLTDAIACEEFVNESRFHNNLYLASNYAKNNKLNVQEHADKCGLMPYQYEYDSTLKIYSLTIDLEMIGKDDNFETPEASKEEKSHRVISMLEAVEHLNLIVKGNLDNAEPIFIVGGLSDRKTHYFENVIRVKDNSLLITKDLKDRLEKKYKVGLLEGGNFRNETEIINELNPISITRFFDELKEEIERYYEV